MAPSADLSGAAATLPQASERIGRRPARFEFLNWSLFGTGVLLRVAQYLANRSLWLDEAYLVPTILRRSFAELLRPPDYGQVVPVGFLALERAAVALLGDSEYALRLVPLAAGVGSLLLFRRLALRTLPPRAVPLALALFVFGDPLISFSSELKPYSLDVAIAIFLLDRALDVRENPEGSGPLWRLALSGAVAIWFSHPAVFVLAGIGATLAASALLRRRRVAPLALTGLAWVASFTLFYVSSLASIGRRTDVLAFWARAFLPLPPRSFDDLYWLPRELGALFANPVGLVFRGLGIFGFLVGGTVLLRSDRQRLALLVSPILVTLLASGLKWYPFDSRLLLFLVPSILLLVAEGVEGVRAATAGRAPAIGTILIALLLFHPILFSVRFLLRPRVREEIKPVLGYVRQHEQAGDRLYVYAAAAPAFDYYAPRLGIAAEKAVRGTWSGESGDPLRDLERVRGGRRTWFLFSHARRAAGVDDEKRFLAQLGTLGVRLDAFRAPGATVYLYDLNVRAGVRARAGRP